jgi:tRNA pseudouridine55 synthase
MRLGATTPSFDLETEVDGVYDTSHITKETVETVLQQFTGSIKQIPPAYSAVKVQGDKAYDLARKGIAVELKPKLLVIDEIELLSFQPDELKVRIVCSKGTYIRALARDIGIALHSGAHLIQLQRTRIGDITLDKCWNIDNFTKSLRDVSTSVDTTAT